MVTAEGPHAADAAVETLLGEVGVGPSGSRPLAPIDAPEVRVTLEHLLEVGAGTVGPGGHPGRALLVVGSPRRKRSTSAALGDYLAGSLRRSGIMVDRLTVREVVEDEGNGRDALAMALDGADLLVLAFPLYVDTLPAPLVKMLEWVAAWGLPSGRSVRLVALVNSGFPEAEQNTPALSMCRRFAVEMGMSWGGGLALGAGAAIDGRELEAVGGMARSVIRALDLAAEALVEGRPVPRDAVRLMAKPMMPGQEYRLAGDRGFRSLAAAQGTVERLDDRPYEPSDSGGRGPG